MPGQGRRRGEVTRGSRLQLQAWGRERFGGLSLRYLVSGLCWGLGLLMVFWRPGPNLWFGVRLPWTLADPWIWDKSWRLASRILMVMGITVLISWRAFYVSTAHLVGLSCLYTVILYRWKYGTWRFWKDHGWIDYRPVARCRRCGHFQKLDSHADLAQGTCEACGAKLPEPTIGLKALLPLWAKKG